MSYEIINKVKLSENIYKISFVHEDIAKNYQVGQFCIIRVDEFGERIPLTIHEVNGNVISVIFLVCGVSTIKLSEASSVVDLCGPLGKPCEFKNYRKILVIGGGTGTAIAYPLVKEAVKQNIKVTSLIGFRNKDNIILEDEFKALSRTIIYTDDGSYGKSGYVTNELDSLLKEDYDCCFVIGPLLMMKSVCLITKNKLKTIVSMNPIMIDGTGMCGCCRLTVDGVMKFACVDGPDFDGSKVDFDEMILRNNTYVQEEKHKCNLYRGLK